MIRRVLSLSVVALFALSAISAWGQDTAAVSRAEFQKAIDELKQQIQSLKTPVGSTASITPAEAAKAPVPAPRDQQRPAQRAGRPRRRGSETRFGRGSRQPRCRLGKADRRIAAVTKGAESTSRTTIPPCSRYCRRRSNTGRRPALSCPMSRQSATTATRDANSSIRSCKASLAARASCGFATR